MKNSKKRIYRPRDYMKAQVIGLIVSILCIAITQPILMGVVKYYGIQNSIKLVAMDAEKYGWTESLTAQGKEYEAEREEMAKENVVIDWCYKNSKTTFAAVIRDINIIICGIIFVFGVGLAIFSFYCLGRDVRQCGLPYLAKQWKRAIAFVKSKWLNIKQSKAEKVREKVYEQFGIETK